MVENDWSVSETPRNRMSRILRTMGELFRPCSPRARSPVRPSSTFIPAEHVSELTNPSPGSPSSLLNSPNSLNPLVPPRCPSRPASAVQVLSHYKDTPNTEITSFYRRELPSDLVSFTSYLGRLLFKEALDEGTVENYFSLVGNFTHQSETACNSLTKVFLIFRLWSRFIGHGIERNGG
jgi:hypothetical protein